MQSTAASNVHIHSWINLLHEIAVMHCKANAKEKVEIKVDMDAKHDYYIIYFYYYYNNRIVTKEMIKLIIE